MKINPSSLLQKALFLSVIFCVSILFSCKKDGKLAPDFDSGNLSVHFVDTFSIQTSVVQEDSLRTDGLLYNLLGIYNDAELGFVSSSIYTQVLLTGANIDFGNSPTLDSVVLTLDYLGIYGDKTSQMSVDVYKISSELDINKDYYSSTDDVLYDPTPLTPLGGLTFTPNLTDSVSIDFDAIVRKPHLRIKLNNSFGQDLMDAHTNDLANDLAFTKFMNGLYITTSDSVTSSTLSSGQGSIVSFNMNSSMSTLTLYYNGTSSYDFTINSNCEKFSRFAHNYTGKDLENHINNTPTKNTNRIYVATMARAKTKIELPTIKNLLAEGDILINKAEITLTLEDGTEVDPDIPLEKLALVAIGESGNSISLLDELEGSDHFGGSYNETNKTYTFNITRHLHQLIHSNTPDYGMYLVSKKSTISANRSILGSENSPSYKIRLEITYSKI